MEGAEAAAIINIESVPRTEWLLLTWELIKKPIPAPWRASENIFKIFLLFPVVAALLFDLVIFARATEIINLSLQNQQDDVMIRNITRSSPATTSSQPESTSLEVETGESQFWEGEFQRLSWNNNWDYSEGWISLIRPSTSVSLYEGGRKGAKIRRGYSRQHDSVECSSSRHDLVINFLVIFGTNLILLEILTCEDCDVTSSRLFLVILESVNLRDCWRQVRTGWNSHQHHDCCQG